MGLEMIRERELLISDEALRYIIEIAKAVPPSSEWECQRVEAAREVLALRAELKQAKAKIAAMEINYKINYANFKELVEMYQSMCDRYRATIAELENEVDGLNTEIKGNR